MKKLLMVILFLTVTARIAFCQSGNFPMDQYQRAVEKRDFAAITGIIKKYGTNTDYYEQSILWQAIKSNDVELVRVMLEAGIPTSLNSYTDAGFFSVYFPTIRDNQFDMVKLLTEYYPINPSDIDTAVSYGNIGVLDLFIRKGADLHGIKGEGGYYSSVTFTYFNTAVQAGRLELAERFLRDGHLVNMLDTFARLDFVNPSKNFPESFPTIASALDYATANGNEEMKAWLLKNGAKTGYEILHGMSMSEIEERFGPKNAEVIVGGYRLTAPGPYRPTTDDLRYRAEPTLTGAVLGLLNTRDVLYVVCRSKEKMDIDTMSDYWFYVISDTGKRGWAYGGYIEPDQD